MTTPPSGKPALYKTLAGLVVGRIMISAIMFIAGSQVLQAKDQRQTQRLTNNKTFYSSQMPLLLQPPSSTLVALRHVPTYEPISVAFDLANANKLAAIAKRNASFKSSRGKCMRWVRYALTKFYNNNDPKNNKGSLNLNFLPTDHPSSHVTSVKNSKTRKKKNLLTGRSAEDFKNWALNNPVSLCKRFKFANVSDYPDIRPQNGFILLYSKNTCGFSPRYGHIEVLADATKGIACSDHCRTITQPCKPELILAPVAHCEWIAPEEKKALVSVPPSPVFISKYIERKIERKEE